MYGVHLGAQFKEHMRLRSVNVVKDFAADVELLVLQDVVVVPELVDLDIAVRDEWDEGVTEKSHPQSSISLWIIKDISSTSLTHMVIVSTLSSRLLKMFSFR